MRLTLRTLLAYRDRVLSPGDREDLHSRVQKSEPASNLLRRIDSVAARKNLNAPPPMGTGLGSDANSISEYLDDAMPAAQVPEMEVVCLNSDVQLGELANCHSILSTAVEQQIDVPQALYDRVLKFGSVAQQTSRTTESAAAGGASGPIVRVDKAHTEPNVQPEKESRSEAVEVTVPMVASAGTSIAPQGLDLENSSLSQEVPEYLVGTRRGAWGIPLAIGGLLALLCILLWQSLGPWDRVASLFKNDNVATTPAAVDTEIASEQPNNEAPPKADVVPSTPEESNTASDGETASAVDSTGGEPDMPTPAMPAADVDQPADIPSVAGDLGSPASSSLATWTPASEREATSTVLMRDTNGLVTQLLPNNVVGIGSTLVIPRGINTTVTLPGGLQATNMGDSVVSLQDPGAASVSMDVQMCRWVITNDSPDQTQRISIQYSGKSTSIELAAAASVSLEISPRRSKQGAATEPGVFKPARTIIALSGSAVVRDPASRNPITLATGEGVALFSDEQPREFELQRVPGWLRPGAQRAIDRLGAADLNQQLASLLDSGQTAQQALKQASETSRPETAAAAVRCSMLLGDFSALVPALGNPRLSAHWFGLLRLADQSIATDSDAALQSLKLARGDADGSALLTQIAGPTKDSIEDSLTQLIAGLESKTLATRVLSIHRLREITGATMGYLPHRPSRESVAQWRRELAAERLEVLPAPEILPERTPLQ
ncbi:MAG: hypothetical protein Aurels2KO_36580 [Aureliella sp.]